jgi:hypothetical protein
MAGRCYTELRRPAEAVLLLSAVLERYGDARAREACTASGRIAASVGRAHGGEVVALRRAAQAGV